MALFPGVQTQVCTIDILVSDLRLDVYGIYCYLFQEFEYLCRWDLILGKEQNLTTEYMMDLSKIKRTG